MKLDCHYAVTNHTHTHTHQDTKKPNNSTHIKSCQVMLFNDMNVLTAHG